MLLIVLLCLLLLLSIIVLLSFLWFERINDWSGMLLLLSWWWCCSPIGFEILLEIRFIDDEIELRDRKSCWKKLIVVLEEVVVVCFQLGLVECCFLFCELDLKMNLFVPKTLCNGSTLGGIPPLIGEEKPPDG